MFPYLFRKTLKVRSTLLQILCIIIILMVNTPRVLSCQQPTPTPIGWRWDPTPVPIRIQVARANEYANIVVEGTVTEIGGEYNFSQGWGGEVIGTIRVIQYLKGKGPEVIQIVEHVSPCTRPSFLTETRGIFFASGNVEAEKALEFVDRLDITATVIDTVIEIVGQKPIIPPTPREAVEPSPAETSSSTSTIFFLLFFLLLIIVIVLFLLWRSRNRKVQ